MNKAFWLVSGVALLGLSFCYVYQPDFSMDYNVNNGTGVVQFGNKIVPFKKGETVKLKTWNGFELVVDGTTVSYSLKRFGQTIFSEENSIV